MASEGGSTVFLRSTDGENRERDIRTNEGDPVWATLKKLEHRPKQ